MPRCAGQYLALSNLLTYLAVICGLMAVSMTSLSGSWSPAGLLIAGSVILDIFDGRFARRFNRTPEAERFGIELDSLADAVNFGVVPVVCLFLLTGFPGAGAQIAWGVASTFFTIAALTRLGTYNLDQAGAQSFTGMPTTLAGLIWATIFIVHPSWLVSGLMLAVLGLAMIAPIPIRRPQGACMWILVAWWAIVAGTHAFRLLNAIGNLTASG